MHDVILERLLLPIDVDSHVLDNLHDETGTLFTQLVSLDACQIAQLETDKLLQVLLMLLKEAIAFASC